MPRVRGRVTLSQLLDGVTLASLGLMAGVTWQLGRDAIVDPMTLILFLAAVVLLMTRNVNSAVLILVGGVAGLLSAVI